MTPNGQVKLDDEPLEADLVFREQADGRKVARLPGGKVVLLDINQLDAIADGEKWHVRLRHKDTFAIAEPVGRVKDFVNPVLPGVAAILARNAVAPPANRVPDPQPAATRAAAPPASAASAAPIGLPPQPAPIAAAPAAPPPATALPPPPAAVAPVAAKIPPPVNVTALDPSRFVRAGDRVALFIDGANMDGACRSAGYFVDYRKAREFAVASGTFNAAYYYVADFTASDPLQQRFLDFLSHAGYIVRRRPVKVINDQDTGERIIKGNLDTEIVLDMLNTVGNYDVAFLFSGDSDFERAVDLLRSRGKRIYIVTSRAALSRELLYVADKPVFFLEDFRSALIRERTAASPVV